MPCGSEPVPPTPEVMRVETFSIRMLPGALRVAAEHRRAGQQLDNLCAAHWVAILLRADGFPVDPEGAAIAAGTVLPEGDPRAFVPSGVKPNEDYRAAIPYAERPEEGGTPAPGMIEAVESLSQGRRALVPLRASWTSERVIDVLDSCLAHPAWEAIPLANVRTGRYWGSRLPLGDMVAWLAGRELEPPVPEWDVGHVVSLAGTVDGPDRSLVIVRDSYPALGWDGHHFQPPEALAAALERGDGNEGGVALYVSADDRAEVERVVKDMGFDVAAWDNGTPWRTSRRKRGP